ncbi:hypothetical protein FHR20_002577 [Sphingomonas leidyi]|jgi:hypothetical protein|uniref:Uncharacterized protein n=1 Tax=Sphingomonas leidyi TaxID=68569 RepID=A0A7X5V0J8_9SPHN|nr:hypothetical protein [Sphingomonas leidyi]NIJ65615.1 hypothetical protein [Sphingomonas leidyi]
MRVELDVFSGRPNPVWQLDAQAAAALVALHDVLAAGTAWEAPPALGYRGFLYTIRSDGCRAYHGAVRTAQTILADPGYSIERFLIARLPHDWIGLVPMIEGMLRPRE